MDGSLRALPELATFDHPAHVARIPPGDDVPLTERVARLLDSRALRRLSRISQLGLVSLVYPGATHSRFEHSLGVYRNALLFLRRLVHDDQFSSVVSRMGAEAFLITALLHDIGHWPFCHPLEDMQLPSLPEHEHRVRDLLTNSDLDRAIRSDWNLPTDMIVSLLEGHSKTPELQVLQCLLSGPLDIDKLDYLQRDSLHAGVPYGRNFDAQRLINSLCIRGGEKPRLAINDKGRTAAEMMVFSRYVMFSEVYWHHAVRSATAMLQRAVWLLADRLELSAMCNLDEHAWIDRLRQTALGTLAEPLVEGLFGEQRRLYKRVSEFNVLDQPELHASLARRPYEWQVGFSQRLAEHIGRKCGVKVTLADVLVDAPPRKLEVDINIDVVSRNAQVRSLGEVSPIVDALAHRQFDNQVKRVRVFVPVEIRAALGGELPMEVIFETLRNSI